MQVAYLASSLFLDYKSDLIILVVNTITQDLKSDNYLIGEGGTRVCSASQIISLCRSRLFSLVVQT